MIDCLYSDRLCRRLDEKTKQSWMKATSETRDTQDLPMLSSFQLQPDAFSSAFAGWFRIKVTEFPVCARLH